MATFSSKAPSSHLLKQEGETVPSPVSPALQKPRASQDEILKALKWLCATFPAVFNLADRKPLKSNIIPL